MDVVTTLTFFDKWRACHQETCGEHPNVSTERDDDALRVILACPVCTNTISGAIRERDWPTVVALLDKKKQS